MKKLTTITLILALCSLLSISGCWIEKKGDEDAVEDMTTEEITAELETVEEETVFDEEVEQAIEDLTAIVTNEEAQSSDCDALEDEDLKQACQQTFIYREAVASGDETMCESLLNEYDAEKCLEEVNN